jgi:hypothetical protein
MTTRAAFLEEVWTQVINAGMSGRWIDNVIASSERIAGCSVR